MTSFGIARVAGQQESHEVDGLERNMPFLLRMRIEGGELERKREHSSVLTAVTELVETHHRAYDVLKNRFYR
jgi:hypothetical protein